MQKIQEKRQNEERVRRVETQKRLRLAEEQAAAEKRRVLEQERELKQERTNEQASPKSEQKHFRESPMASPTKSVVSEAYSEDFGDESYDAENFDQMLSNLEENKMERRGNWISNCRCRNETIKQYRFYA